MIAIEDIRKVVENRGSDKEHLMLIMRDLENMSGKNQVSVEDMRNVAEIMNIPESFVSGFIGFYTMFSPKERAKYLIRVCKSGPCHVMGARTIFDAVEEHLGIKPGESTPDLEYTLETVACIGACALAPTMTINSETHGEMTTRKVTEIFGTGSEEGQE